MQKCFNILTPKLLPTIRSLLCILLAGGSVGTHLLFRLSFTTIYTVASVVLRLKYLTISSAPWRKVHREEQVSVMYFYLQILKMQAPRQQLLIAAAFAMYLGF
jgi:hypothetical protein